MMTAFQQAVPTFPGAFASRLLRARLQCGLTQQQLAEMVGVSQQAITQWESGQALPRARRRKTVAEVLGADLSDVAIADAMRAQAAQFASGVVYPSRAAELLMAELIIVTMLGLLTNEQKEAAHAQLTAGGIAGADPIRSHERRAAIVAGGVA